MNKTLVIASVLMAAALTTGIFSTNPMAAYADDDDDYGDSSETNTEQKIKQKNVGGDGASQFNCGQNNINPAQAEEGLLEADIDLCGTLTVDIGGDDGPTAPGPVIPG
jgi:hypothetical protein